MEGETANSLARGTCYPPPAVRSHSTDTDLNIDVVQLHMAAEQDVDVDEQGQNSCQPAKGAIDGAKVIRDISSAFRTAAAGSSSKVYLTNDPPS